MTSTVDTWDVFISYARLDLDAVLPIQEALEARGLHVWRDESEIDTFDAITSGVRDGVARSKVLLAYYSTRYPTRRACQWELTAAFLAAERVGDPRDRILVVNPQQTSSGLAKFDHIEPVQLRDAVFAKLPPDATAADLEALALCVAEHLSGVNTTLGESGSLLSRSLGLRPVSSPAFVGRLTELWALHSALTAAEAVQITGAHEGGVVALAGVAGGGKSLLAEEYVLRYAAAWPGGVFWFSAAVEPGDPSAAETSRASQLRTVAAQLQIPIDGRSTEEIAGSMRAFIEQLDGRCLWVVDDVPAGLSASELKAWLAPDARATTLLTCKTREYSNLAQESYLGGLSSADAYLLLVARRTPASGDEERAGHDIVESLAGHALALAICGAELRLEAGMRSFADYRDSLDDPSRDALELAAELADELPTGHEPSIAATLLRSIELLDEAGRDLLRLASGLAVAPIPTALIRDTFGLADNLDPPVALERAKRAVAGVDRYCLAETADPAGETRVVHALVSRTVRFRDDDHDRADQLHAAASTPLSHLIDQALQPGVLEPGMELLITHARALQQSAWPASALGRIADSVAKYDFRSGDYIGARDAQREILAIRRAELGPDHVGTIEAETNLALTLRNLREFAEAKRLQEHVLEIRSELHGRRSGWTALTMNNLAAVLSDAGELEDARALTLEALEIAQSELAPDDADVLTVLGNLAGTFRGSGDLETALALDEQILESRQRVLGDEHSLTLLAMNNLAGTLKASGHLARAAELQAKVVEARRRLLGERHPDTLIAMDNLAGIRLEGGQFEEARELQLNVLTRYRELYGDDAIPTLLQMRRLASTLKQLGETDAALDLGRRAYETDRVVFGEDDAETNAARANLGHTLWQLGRYEEARPLQEAALQWLQRIRGPEDDDTLAAQTNLALTFLELGEFTRSRELQREIVAIHRANVGDDHLTTIRARLSMAAIVQRSGEFNAVLPEATEVREALVRLLGPSHQDTLLATSLVAGTLFALGELEGARELQRSVVDERRRALGDNHPATRAALADLARVEAALSSRAAPPKPRKSGRRRRFRRD